MMMLWIGLAVLLMVLCWISFYSVLHFFFYREHQPDEIHFAETADGFRIALYRYLPKGESPHPDPVFFCHGLGSDGHNLDLNEKYSWAQGFAKQGLDAWVIDLRGSGKSSVPKGGNWSFDDHIEDARSAIDLILKKTGTEKVHWLGHSMGGILLYAYLGVHGQENVRSAVIMGSPVDFGDGADYKLGLKFAWMLNLIPYVPIGRLVKMLVPLSFLLRILPSKFLFSLVPHGLLPVTPENMEIGDMKVIGYNVVHSPSARIFRQFAHWVRERAFCSEDGKINYRESMKDLQIPLQIFSGTGDKVARPESVRAALDWIPKENIEYIELGKEQGFVDNYGHGDMIFGKKALEEVLPLALDFVLKHQGVKIEL